jgi:hypothetical protein
MSIGSTIDDPLSTISRSRKLPEGYANGPLMGLLFESDATRPVPALAFEYKSTRALRQTSQKKNHLECTEKQMRTDVIDSECVQ